MTNITLTINNITVTAHPGQTILDAARRAGIDIPALCHDDRVAMYGSCGVCAVEVEGSPRLARACSTPASDGMVIHTNTPRAAANRRAALELLLSDHTGDCRAPCMSACPAGTDCQGYVGLIANGQYEEALRLIKNKIPFPASIGRVCPHPCEEACRRKLVEEPVSIAALKRFAGDRGLENGAYTADVGAPTGKTIAVVGGGPGGLSAAYFLCKLGHSVAIYDAMPEMGGMLRYGIPEYRLPKKVLDQEIDAIKRMGVEFRNGQKIGRDITLDHLRGAYDAVIIAAGAWVSVGLGCPGEQLDGVIGGIDFLRSVALGHPVSIGRPVAVGRRVAVVGGGSVAMDACRTAVRLGAGEVYVIYRRTRNEMPAEQIEIREAEEEGVVFKYLANPIEILGRDGKVKAVRLQLMELGRPDASGRRAPVPIEGREETIEVDSVIVAIGQQLDAEGFEGIELNKRGLISADELTMRTNLDGVFAIGDAANKGPDIAVTAIGEARRAAEMADRYIRGEELCYKPPFLVSTEKTAEDFAGRDKAPRARSSPRPAAERGNDFLETDPGLTREQAEREATRCLECGCRDYFECKLIKYAGQYDIQPGKYNGAACHHEHKDDHPFILRDPDKCILCGLCVRICEQAVGATALGLVGRGFDAVVRPALDAPLRDTDCTSCGQCVAACPTGALTEALPIAKQVPLEETITETVCAFCSVGCKTRLTAHGDLLLRCLPCPEQDGLLCVKGRFGFGEIARDRLLAPFIRRDGGMERVTFEEAIAHANKNLRELAAQYGGGCLAVAISDRYTNEEAFLIKKYANKALETDKVFCFNQAEGGLAGVLGRDASTATFDDMENAELIVAILPDSMTADHAVIGMRMRRAVGRGAKLLLISSADGLSVDNLSADGLLDDIATLRLDAGGDLSLLLRIAAALLDSGRGKDMDGYDEFAASLEGITPCNDARAAADMLLRERKAVFIFERNILTGQGAGLVAGIAALGGHSVIQLLPGANSQGLINLGVQSGERYIPQIESGEIRGLFIFGEDVGIDLGKLDFLAVQDLRMTATAMQAGVVLPASSPAEISGGFTGADGRPRELTPAVCGPLAEWDGMAQIKALSAQAGWIMPYQSIGDVRQAMRGVIVLRPGGLRLAVANGELRRSGCRNTNALCVSLMERVRKA